MRRFIYVILICWIAWFLKSLFIPDMMFQDNDAMVEITTRVSEPASELIANFILDRKDVFECMPQITNSPGFIDAWGQTLSCTVSIDEIVITSSGKDIKFGTEDDIIVTKKRIEN